MAEYVNYDEEENEDEVTTIDLKKDLIRRMAALDPSKQEDRSQYAFLNEQLSIITESERNETQTEATEKAQYQWILPTLVQVAGNLAGTMIGNVMNRRNVTDVIRSEEQGHIINSSATKFMNKPRS